jgi:hypothetical protein
VEKFLKDNGEFIESSEDPDPYVTCNETQILR